MSLSFSSCSYKLLHYLVLRFHHCPYSSGIKTGYWCLYCLSHSLAWIVSPISGHAASPHLALKSQLQFPVPRVMSECASSALSEFLWSYPPSCELYPKPTVLSAEVNLHSPVLVSSTPAHDKLLSIYSYQLATLSSLLFQLSSIGESISYHG